jgi:hypothetical protein
MPSKLKRLFISHKSIRASFSARYIHIEAKLKMPKCLQNDAAELITKAAMTGDYFRRDRHQGQ